MIIAVPCENVDGLNSARSGHFGHAAFFALATVEDEQITKLEFYQNVDHDQYGCGGVIQFALSLGIDVMITVGMGVPPLTRFTEAGVKVYSDRVSPTVGEALAAFAAGETQLMDPSMACRH